MFKKSGSLYGLLFGLVAVFGAYLLEGGSFKALFLFPAMLIVFGGTFSATIIGVGFDKFKKMFSLIRMAYFPPKYDIKQLIDGFIKVSVKSRQEGLLAIEGQLNRLIYHFPKKMMHFVMDGTEIDLLESIAYGEMKAMQGRHDAYISMFNKMGIVQSTPGLLTPVSKALRHDFRDRGCVHGDPGLRWHGLHRGKRHAPVLQGCSHWSHL